MTYQDEQRRQFIAPEDRDPPLRSGMEWGLPLGLAGAAIVIGLIFYNVNHQPTLTASHTGAATQSAPAPSAAKAPAPTKTE